MLFPGYGTLKSLLSNVPPADVFGVFDSLILQPLSVCQLSVDGRSFKTEMQQLVVQPVLCYRA